MIITSTKQMTSFSCTGVFNFRCSSHLCKDFHELLGEPSVVILD